MQPKKKKQPNLITPKITYFHIPLITYFDGYTLDSPQHEKIKSTKIGNKIERENQRDNQDVQRIKIDWLVWNIRLQNEVGGLNVYIVATFCWGVFRTKKINVFPV